MYHIAADDVEAGPAELAAFQREPILEKHRSFSSDEDHNLTAPYAPVYPHQQASANYQTQYKSSPWEGDPAKQPLKDKSHAKKEVPDLPLIDQNLFLFKLLSIVGIQLTLACLAAAFCLNRGEIRRWLGSTIGEIFTLSAGVATFAIHCSFKMQNKGKCKKLSKGDNWTLLIVFTILEGILLCGTSCAAAQSKHPRIAWGGVALVQAFAHSAVICFCLAGTAFLFRRRLEVAHPKSLFWVIIVAAVAIAVRFLFRQIDEINNPIWHTFVMAATVLGLGVYLVMDSRRIVRKKGGFAYKNDLAGGAMELYSDYAAVLIGVFTVSCITIGKCKICTEPMTQGDEKAEKNVKRADVLCKLCV